MGPCARGNKNRHKRKKTSQYYRLLYNVYSKRGKQKYRINGVFRQLESAKNELQKSNRRKHASFPCTARVTRACYRYVPIREAYLYREAQKLLKNRYILTIYLSKTASLCLLISIKIAQIE